MIPGLCKTFPALFQLASLVILSLSILTSSASARHAKPLLATRTAREKAVVRDVSQATDNFDPAQADPHYNISCLGTSYDLQLPSSPGFDPNEVTMQRLCAKPQFNGGKPYQHLGGWCNWYPTRSKVVFDLSAAAQIHPFYANPRILLGCFNRCFCNFGLPPNTTSQPKAAPYMESWESDQTYEVQADVTDNFDAGWTFQMKPLDSDNQVDVPTISHKGRQGSSLVSVAEVATFGQVERMEDRWADPRIAYVSMDADNEIECHGVIPLWPFPPPYTRFDFSTLQELCSVSFFGGNK